MDVFSLNYRQLQSEAKKHGIKANQKIDILRLKIKEALNKSSNDVELNSFIVTSTPSVQNSRCSFLNLNTSSSEDIDKILSTNRRNSQFFDDILNFRNNENTNQSNSDNNKENSKEILKSNSFHESEESIHQNEMTTPKQKHELNVTFEMDDHDKQESQITEEQRKLVSIDKKSNAHCKNADPIFRPALNHEKKYLAVNHKINNYNNNKTNFLGPKNLSKPKEIKSINKCIPVAENSKLTKPSGNIRKSNIVSQKFCANPIYQKKLVRPSLLPPIDKSSSRKTMYGLTKKII